MTTRKRNEWLEDHLSDDDDDAGYDSEAAEESRSKALHRRTPKRQRRADSDSSSDDDDETDAALPPNLDRESDEGSDKHVLHSSKPRKPSPTLETLPSTDNSTSATTKPAALSAKKLATINSRASATGVIYLPSIPPYMTPAALRNLLTPYGEINRIYLAPEDPALRSSRLKAGGNKKKRFGEGWVEFVSKANAKIVAESLNAKIIGGKKGGWYHDDVLNVRYLKGFKWHHLTEQIANENAERAARLRADIATTTRENKHFVENVERAKMLETMEAKRKKKAEGRREEAAVDETEGDTAAKDVPDLGRGKIKRQFRQNEVKKRPAKEGKKEPSVDVKRVLSKIF